MEQIEKQPVKYASAVGIGIVLFIAATSVTMPQYKIPTIMGEIMSIFSIDAGLASWLMSIFTFVGIIVALPTGLLIKRFGPKKIIMAALIIDVVAGLVGAFAPNVWVLLATRAFEGVSLVFVVACAPLVVQACVDPAKNGTSIGIYMLGGMLGATFAGILTPTLFYSVGYVGLWIGYVVLNVIAIVSVMLFIKMPAAPPAAAADEAGEQLESDDWKVFFKPNTWLFFIPFAVFQMVLLTILAYAPTALQQQGMSPALSGVVSTLPMLLAVVSSIAFGAISDRMGRCKPLCIIGMLVLGPCCFIMLNFYGPIMWVSLVLMGLLAMGTPTVFVAAYPTVLGKPELMSVGMGVLLLVQSLGQFMGTAVSSALLGPNIDQWMLCGIVAMIAALVGAASVAICKFR